MAITTNWDDVLGDWRLRRESLLFDLREQWDLLSRDARSVLADGSELLVKVRADAIEADRLDLETSTGDQILESIGKLLADMAAVRVSQTSAAMRRAWAQPPVEAIRGLVSDMALPPSVTPTRQAWHTAKEQSIALLPVGHDLRSRVSGWSQAWDELDDGAPSPEARQRYGIILAHVQTQLDRAARTAPTTTTTTTTTTPVQDQRQPGPRPPAKSGPWGIVALLAALALALKGK